MAARSNGEVGACQQQSCDRLFLEPSCTLCHGDPGIWAVTGSGWAEVLPPTEPAVRAGDFSARREHVEDEQEEALGSVKKHRNVSASILPLAQVRNEAVEKRDEHTIRSEENINWLYSDTKNWERLIYEYRFFLESMS